MSSPPMQRTLLKVIVLGNSGVGKTSLINRYVHKRFNQQFKPTIGADFATREIQVDGKLVNLQIWDTAGQERFHSLGSAFFRGADSCVLVYDVTVQATFDSLKAWRDDFIKQTDISDPSKFPFVVIGNKIDDTVGRVVPYKSAKEWCTSIEGPRDGVPYFETSALENNNVDEAFFEIAKVALSHGRPQDIYYESMAGSLSEIVEPQQSGCPC
ncbi:hypothetical protein vseg_019317 [Gypsophila vaccaria]